MDKKKVLIVGMGESIHSHVPKMFSEMKHLDVEVVDVLDHINGNHPGLQIWDEHTVLTGVDFSALEERCMGLADAVLADGSTVSYKTGRRQSEPELLSTLARRQGKSALQQDIYAMIAEQTERSREEVKDLYFPHGYGTARFLGQPQQIRKPEKSRYFAAPYGKQEAADHPSRKREPKGPRGKWGKL